MSYDPNLSWEENCAKASRIKTDFPRVMVISDIEPYRSPVDGAYVGGRVSRKEDLKKHDCVPYEPIKNRPRGIGNARFAAKNGLKLDEAAAHRERAKRIDPLADVKRKA